MTAQPKVIHVVPQIPGLPALADDTPSRHPCKIRIPSAQKRYIFDPYKAQVTLGLEVGESSSASDSDCDDGVNEDAFNNANDEHTSHVAPKPVDPLSPFTGAPPQQSDHTVAASVPQFVVVPRMRSLDQPAIATSDPYSAASERQSQQSTINTPPIPRGLLSLTPVPESRLHEPTASTSQRESAVGGAHYTNDDGCFRIHAGSMHHALVRFKFAEDVYVVPPGDRRGLCVGDLVVVEGDRGENIGQVTADYSDQCSQDDVSHKSIIRRALNKDRKKYYHARRKDAMASKAAQQIAQDNHLKMHVLDAEFQSDLMKLTIYFRSFAVEGEAVDFREIQRGLFKQFRCRIWLVNWYEDKSLQRIVQQQLSPQQPQQPMSLPPTPQPAPVAQQQLAPQFTQWAAMQQQQPLRNDFVVSAADSANVFVPVKHINPQETYPPFPQERQSSISERFTTVLAAPTFPVPANFHVYPAQPEQSLITAQHLQIPTNPAPHTTQGLSSRATTGRFAYASRVLR